MRTDFRKDARGQCSCTSKESTSLPSPIPPVPLTFSPPNHHPHPSAATTQNTRSTSPTVVFPWLSLPNRSRNRSSTTPPRSYSARSYSHAAPLKARWASVRRVRRKASAERASTRRSRDTRPMWGVWALKGMLGRVLRGVSVGGWVGRGWGTHYKYCVWKSVSDTLNW
jgi:hypothetical protein